MMDDSWLQELIKYPYFSCKSYSLTIIDKPGKTVYLLKERSKLVRVPRKVIKHEVSSRLHDSKASFEEIKQDQIVTEKRRKTKDSRVT